MTKWSVRAQLCSLSLAVTGAAMQVHTSHFGAVEIEVDDILHFPRGIVAYEDCQHWVLLADTHNHSMAWLQSVSREEVSLPVVSPRRFQSGYTVRVARGQLLPLEFTQFDKAYILAIVSQSDGDLTINLRAPLIINLDRRLGRQVITTDDQPVALPLAPRKAPLAYRKSA
jgi:flagellar assembly factor FliW